MNNLLQEAELILEKNAGEEFEQKLLMKLKTLVLGVETPDEARAAISAIGKIDSDVSLATVAAVSSRAGGTRRSHLSGDEHAEVIADIVLRLVDGTDRYISIKNIRGSSIGQFGIAGAFSPRLKCNVKSDDWKTWIKPFNLSVKKIEDGLAAAERSNEYSPDDTEPRATRIGKDSAIYKMLHNFWGTGYIYLKEVKNGKFKATLIDDDFVHNVLLNKLRVTGVSYPGPGRKQITIYMKSASASFTVEIRNQRGAVRPERIQLKLTGGGIPE